MASPRGKPIVAPREIIGLLSASLLRSTFLKTEKADSSATGSARSSADAQIATASAAAPRNRRGFEKVGSIGAEDSGTFAIGHSSNSRAKIADLLLASCAALR